MGILLTLLLRLALSLVLASVIGFFFFKGNLVIKISGLAAAMFILAYLFEYSKKRE